MRHKAFSQILLKLLPTVFTSVTLVSTISSVAAGQNNTFSFESVNYSGYFIAHQNSSGRINASSNELSRRDSTFRKIDGLGDSSCNSFESVNYPGRYLRHENFRIILSQDDGSQLFDQDATFCMRNGIYNGNGVSFESLNYPGRFIRHRNYDLWLEASDGSDLFRQDATFIQRAPRHLP